MSIKIASFIKDEVRYLLCNYCPYEAQKYHSEKKVAIEWGDRGMHMVQVQYHGWMLKNGYVPYEVEVDGRIYRVKKFKVDSDWAIKKIKHFKQPIINHHVTDHS